MPCPGWCGLVSRVSSHKVKDHRFHAKVRAHAWVTGMVPSWGPFGAWLRHVGEAADGCYLSHQCFSPSLFPYLPLFLK